MPFVEQLQEGLVVPGNITAVFIVSANALQALFTGFGQQIADDFQKDGHIDRFLDQSFHSSGDGMLSLVKLCRNDDGGNEWVQFRHSAEDFPAIARAAIEIQNEQITRLGLEMVQRINSIDGRIYVVVLRLQQLPERFANGMVVIN